MPLPADDQRRLRSATGYIELGMYVEADAELEEIDPFLRALPEVLVSRLRIYHGLEKWELMAVVAAKLVEWNPSEPGFFVDLAYATRRCETLHAAHAVLTRAAALHPRQGTIQFNLACYEAQLGALAKARAHLSQAFEHDEKLRLLALEDADLAPLWSGADGS